MSLIVDPYANLLDKKTSKRLRTYPNYNKCQVDIPFHGIIVGATGAGKTKIVWNLVTTSMKCWTKIYIFAKDINESLYEDIKARYSQAEKKLEKIIVHLSSNLDDLMPVDEFDANENNLVVCDDMVLSQKGEGFKNLQEIYVRGRRQNITTLWCTQSFFKTDMMIRQNVSYVFVKKVRQIEDLKRMLRQYQLGVTIEQLDRMYEIATSNENSWLLIDLKTSDATLRFRNGFSPFAVARSYASYKLAPRGDPQALLGLQR